MKLKTLIDALFLLHCFVAILNQPGLLEDLSQNYEKALPIALYYDHHTTAVQTDITNRILEYYFSNEAPSAAKPENITNVSDIYISSKPIQSSNIFIP